MLFLSDQETARGRSRPTVTQAGLVSDCTMAADCASVPTANADQNHAAVVSGRRHLYDVSDKI